MEVAVISSKGENVSASIWNPLTSSLLASYYGGGSCSPHGLSVVNGYLIANEANKPMLHAWPLNKQYSINKRLIAPGKISCICVSLDSNYIALSVDCKLHIYQTSSGILCGVGCNHFQPINIIRFNSEGTFIGCGGQDGLLTVWHLGDCVQIDQLNKKPFLSVNAHSLPITDLCFSSGDLNSRVFTTSLDRACKIHNIWTKDRIFSGHFENHLTALALCPRESAFYVGDAEGHVREVSLLTPPRKVNIHYSNTSKELPLFKFHENSITCLSVSMDCSLLLSGSNDSTVKLIHIKSRQCLQSIKQEGPVTNCFFYTIPTDWSSNTFKPSYELSDFKSRESVSNFSIDTYTYCDIMSDFDVKSSNKISTINDSSFMNTIQINDLKRINNELYDFAINKLLSEDHSHQFQTQISETQAPPTETTANETESLVSTKRKKPKKRRKVSK